MPVRTLFALAIGATLVVPVALGAAGDVTRVTLTSAGTQLTQAADGPVISGDATHVLFTSTGAFSGVATGFVRQLFSHDVTTGRNTLVSSSASGSPTQSDVDDAASRTSTPYALSFNGRYVAFTSTASGLVGGDTNGRARDVFRKDLVTGAITIVSRDSAGAAPAAGVTGDPSISADGSRVAFTSGDSPLVASDTNGVADIYVADLRSRSINLISRTAAGAQSPVATGHASISADGRAVAFEGDGAASVLAPADADSLPDIYVARIAPRTITLASQPPSGQPDATACLPSLSGTGTRVAFTSGAAMTDCGVATGTRAIDVRDIPAQTTTRASDPITGATGGAVMAFDGDRVAFTDAATPTAVQVRATVAGSLTRVSQTATGTTLGADASRPALSGSGRLAGFAFLDPQVGVTPVAGDTNRQIDAFTGDLGGGDTTAPALSATVAPAGAKVIISGRATDVSGVMDVTVGGRYAAVADDGSFAVRITPGVERRTIPVVARDVTGLSTSTTVATSRDASGRTPGSSPARPQRIRVTIVGRTARVRFRTGISAMCRVEIRKRVTGSVHLSSFRVLGARQGRRAAGTHMVRLPLPKTMPAGRYQVRVLMSSARGLGTAAVTITLP
jgi:hypothetical protein